MKSKVKPLVNIPERLCVRVCYMFEKRICKYVKVNHRGTHTWKSFQDGKVKPCRNPYLEKFSNSWRNSKKMSLYLENIIKC